MVKSGFFRFFGSYIRYLLIVVSVFTCHPRISLCDQIRVDRDSHDAQQFKDGLNSELSKFLSKKSDFFWKKVSEEGRHDKKSVLVEEYLLVSQSWKIPNSMIQTDHPQWTHRVKIYSSKYRNGNTAFLYINNGTLHSFDGKEESSPIYDNLDFVRIAEKTKSVVIDLRDVPNQYLKFTDHPVPLKEDALVAYTWKHFLIDQKEDWILQLLMTKSAVKAMDMVQNIAGYSDIKKFVISGASKRSWAAWLTASMDSRVVGLVSLVMDLIHFKEVIPYLFKVYPAGNPAIISYIPMLLKLHEQSMQKLFSIIDPYSYIQFLTMPKYLISASGDNFFPPGMKHFYYDQLPGEKFIRVIPNVDHYILRQQNNWKDTQKVSDSVLVFYDHFKNTQSLKKIPKMDWNYSNDRFYVSCNKKPKWAKLWYAHNKDKRDFRKVSDNKEGSYFEQKTIYFNRKGRKSPYFVNIEITPPKKGWSAWFVELGFNSGNQGYPDLVQTTEIIITPDTYPPPLTSQQKKQLIEHIIKKQSH